MQGKKSHLLQMRGLKQWRRTKGSCGARRIFYRCVDWNLQSSQAMDHCFCRIFYRCVDWNWRINWNNYCVISRIFYRCVDWNLTAISMTLKDIVASFTDAWIETSIIDAVVSEYQSHLLQMRGLKPTSCVYHSSLFSRIFYRCVDWNPSNGCPILLKKGRIFYRCVDWNIFSSS